MENGFRNSGPLDHLQKRAGGWKSEIRNSKFEILPVFLLMILALGSSGCGKEGVPLPPEIRVAQRTSDLVAFQEGEEAVLRWSYPSMTTSGDALTDVEAVKLWRATLQKGQEPPPPTNAADRQLRRQLLVGEGEVIDVLDPSELDAATRGSSVVYRDDLVRWRARVEGDPESMVVWYGVQTVCCRRRDSEISNVVRILPASPPEPPVEFTLEAGSDGIDVRWADDPDLETIVERSRDGTVWKAMTDEPVSGGEWRDEDAEQGRSWSYRLRSVQKPEGGREVVGEPSPPKRIDHPDTYPPRAPDGIVCLPEGAEVRVRWQVVASAATYEVTRQIGTGQPEILTSDLTTPEFIDQSPPFGELIYLVIARDAVGNSSEATSCTVVMGAIP